MYYIPTYRPQRMVTFEIVKHRRLKRIAQQNSSFYSRLSRNIIVTIISDEGLSIRNVVPIGSAARQG